MTTAARVLVVASMIGLLVLGPGARSGSSSAAGVSCVLSLENKFNLTGTWVANDGGTYWIRQTGTCLWWVGFSGSTDPADIGKAFSNAYFARVSGSSILGEWADVPRGGILGSGTLALLIRSSNVFVKTGETGTGFGGTVWKRTLSSLRVKGSGSAKVSCSANLSSKFNLTGTWLASDGGTYWMRQIGTCLWWVGFSGSTNPAEIGKDFSNTYYATVSGSTVFGQWAEVPRGKTRRYGTLTLSIRSRSVLIKKTGAGSARSWKISIGA